MAAAQENFLSRGVWPGSNGWGRAPGDVVTLADLSRFHPLIRGMVAKTA